MEITKEWIAQHRAVCDAATPGPWEVRRLGRYDDHDECQIELPDDDIELAKYENADFIAAARTALPAAIDALEAALTESEQWKRDYGSAIELLAEKHKRIDDLTAALGAMEAYMQRETEKDAEIERLKGNAAKIPSEMLSFAQVDIAQRLRYGLKYRRPVTIDADEVHIAMNAIEQSARLTAERDAEKRRADAVENDLFEELTEPCKRCKYSPDNGGDCDRDPENNEMFSCWVWDDPDAPTGAESEVTP